MQPVRCSVIVGLVNVVNYVIDQLDIGGACDPDAVHIVIISAGHILNNTIFNLYAIGVVDINAMRIAITTAKAEYVT